MKEKRRIDQYEFWTFKQMVSYYEFALISYNGKPQINKTTYLKEAYRFGKTIFKV